MPVSRLLVYWIRTRGPLDVSFMLAYTSTLTACVRVLHGSVANTDKRLFLTAAPEADDDEDDDDDGKLICRFASIVVAYNA